MEEARSHQTICRSMSVPIRAVRNYHKLRGFKQHTLIPLQCWRLEVSLAKIKVSVGCVPSGGPKGEPILYLFQLPEAASFPRFVALFCLLCHNCIVLASAPVVTPLLCSSCFFLLRVITWATGMFQDHLSSQHP